MAGQSAGTGVDRIYYPERSNQVPDRATLSLVVLSPDQGMDDEKKTKAFVETTIREYGTSSRTFKSGLIFCAPQSAGPLREDARRLLAWNEIHDDLPSMSIDETQRTQLDTNIKRSQGDLKENVWRTYKNILLLGKDNTVRVIDLGLVTSSSADNLLQLILTQLRQSDDIQSGISPNFLVRNWPPAFKEWSTKAVRDAFFASPLFPRLLSPDAIKDTIARGVASGQIAYVAKTLGGKYQPFLIERTMEPTEVEVSDEVFIITRETADAYREGQRKPEEAVQPSASRVEGGETPPTYSASLAEVPAEVAGGADMSWFTSTEPSGVRWTGQIPAQKWMNFYTKVLTRLGVQTGLKLTVSVDYTAGEPLSKQKLDEVRSALRELGLSDKLD